MHMSSASHVAMEVLSSQAGQLFDMQIVSIYIYE